MKQILLLVFVAVQTMSAVSAEEEKPPEFIPLTDNLYMMTYSYPNIGVLVGEDGLLLVDSNLKENSQIVFDALQKEFGDLPVKYVVSTHSHSDHTGGVSFLMGKGAVSIIHKNARLSLVESRQSDELPAITYAEKMNLHFGDEKVQVIHVPDAHTNGDSIVYFEQSNVIALGDNYFGNASTFGDNLDGMIRVYEKVLAMSDGKTVLIPSHGVHSNKRELTSYLVMLNDVRSTIKLAIENGKSLEAVKADQSITAKYDKKYGNYFINGEQFREFIYKAVGG